MPCVPKTCMNNMDQSRSLLLKALAPVAIGLGVVAWLFFREFNAATLTDITFDARSVAAIFVAMAFMVLRQAALSWRFRILSDGRLSWAAALRVTVMCEFTSAITPTSAGGSAMSMLFMKREGIDLGRATTITMTTLFLDQFFMVAVGPLMLMLAPMNRIFGFGSFVHGVRISFWIVFALVALVALVLFWATLVRPDYVGALVRGLFRRRWLRRWQAQAEQVAADITATGHDLRRRPLRWWARAFGATAGVWIFRFLIVNALFFGFVAGADQLVVLSRQYVVWTLLTVSPTPGGSGVSEWLFTNYYGDMVATKSVALILSVFWRLISYYAVLAAGAILLPAWIRGFRRRS